MEKLEKPIPSTKTKVKQLTSPVPPPPLPPLEDKPGVGEMGAAKGAGELVAKSPPVTPPGGTSSTLQSRGSEETRRDEAAMRVLTYGGLQMLSGLLMLVLGVLSLVHKASMGQYGAGLWGGAAAMSTGLAGVLAGLRGYYHPGERLSTTGLTVHLALALVSVAVSSLALVLTSTGLLRDIHQPPVYLDQEDSVDLTWAPVLCSVGLLLITALLIVSLVLSVVKFHRQVCPCTRHPPAHRLLESPVSHYKQGLVHSWLGQQQPPPVLYPTPQPPPLLVYPPPLFVEGNGLYTVPPSSIGYPQCMGPLQPNPYMQRRRSPHPHAHPHRGVNSVTPDNGSRSRRQEKQRRRQPEKKKEITDEQLERTYTGLDREIAEEFISISMTNPESSQRSRSSSSQLRPSSRDRVIDCIAPM